MGIFVWMLRMLGFWLFLGACYVGYLMILGDAEAPVRYWLGLFAMFCLAFFLMIEPSAPREDEYDDDFEDW